MSFRDAVSRGWKLGACANSDKHRRLCGDGDLRTTAFGKEGGLTRVLSLSLDCASIAKALQGRYTSAMTAESLVSFLCTNEET